MKERPIIFSSEMVLAILDGRKTQTRRVIKPQPEASLSRIENSNLWTYTGCDREWKCPYGQPGDRLWVKEMVERGFLPHLLTGGPTKYETAVYATDKVPCLEENGFDLIPWWKGKVCSARFMPRWASRITVEITGVRVARLQDMNFYDWVADFCPSPLEQERALETFVGLKNMAEVAKILWDSLNAKRGFGWDMNPWVWAIEFKRAKEGGAHERH